jgi:hypothetical protein
MKYQNDADDYLTMYPRATKWINQYIVCQRRGFKPEMPRDQWPNLRKEYSARAFSAELRPTPRHSNRYSPGSFRLRPLLNPERSSNPVLLHVPDDADNAHPGTRRASVREHGFVQGDCRVSRRRPSRARDRARVLHR